MPRSKHIRSGRRMAMGIISKTYYGINGDRMTDARFRIMAFFFTVRDALIPYDRKLDHFGIRPGDTVVDYGCGTGNCLERASILVGADGTVYAADIHPLAVGMAQTRLRKRNLGNVRPVLLHDGEAAIPAQCADIIYALDMFHMVSEPIGFLKGLHALLKPAGKLIIEPGHQPMIEARRKIEVTGLFTITEENRQWLVCVKR
jgi:cyclopropane fatty-acyl-phospholipid synthase-like methyltransferase